MKKSNMPITLLFFLLMTIKIEFRGLVNILQDIWLNLKF